jgi:hypothetical protein
VVGEQGKKHTYIIINTMYLCIRVVERGLNRVVKISPQKKKKRFRQENIGSLGNCSATYLYVLVWVPGIEI